MGSELVDGMWDGRTCIIVGGGPSLRGFDWDRVARAQADFVRYLWGPCVIAINRARESVLAPDLWLAADAQFWRTRPRDGYGCTRVWVDHELLGQAQVDVGLRCAAPDGTPNRHWALAWGRSLEEGVGIGGNSGFAALNLADILGASAVYLLGFDMQGGNFHDGYGTPGPTENTFRLWIEAFRWAATQVRSKVVVLEVTPGDSKLDCFEKRLAKEVL